MAVDGPWLERRVVNYAHQAGAKEAPSSTLYAIERALAAGATGIELDVHPSADGVLVVCHDPTLDRTTDGTGRIAERRASELRSLDNAYYFVPGEDAVAGHAPDAYPLRGRAPADRRFGVAELAEVLASFPGVVLNLDIKQRPPSVAAYEPELAALLRAHRRSGDDVIVASFHDAATAAFGACAPEIATSPGMGETTAFVQAVLAGAPVDPRLARHAALQVPARFAGVEVVTERLVEVAHGLGVAVHVWTVDDEQEMARLVALGVDGIITNLPSRLAALLERLGVAWGA